MSTYGAYRFLETTIGRDWTDDGKDYMTDRLLDYMNQMIRIRNESDTDKLRKECENEITAVKEIMEKQSHYRNVR